MKIFGINIGGNKESDHQLDEEEITSNLLEGLKNFQPKVPGVNLLPQRVHDRYAVEKTRNLFALILACILIVLGGLYGGTLLIHKAAQEKIDDVVTENSALSAELDDLALYRKYFSSIDSKRAILQQAFQNDVTYDEITSTLLQYADSNDVQISSLQFGVVNQNVGGASCSSPNPFEPFPTIGCITLSATTGSVNNLADFTTAINEGDGFLYGYFPNATITVSEEGVITVDFDGSIAFGADFSTVRYPDLAVPLDQQVFGTSATGAVDPDNPQGSAEAEGEEENQETPDPNTQNDDE